MCSPCSRLSVGTSMTESPVCRRLTSTPDLALGCELRPLAGSVASAVPSPDLNPWEHPATCR